MNMRMTVYIIGLLIAFEGLFMAVPTITAAVYHESEFWLFLAIAVFCLLLGWLLTLIKPADKKLFARDGFLIVALGWILLGLIGAMPFYISGAIPQFVDALFESVSGLTTTGASILSDLDALPRCMIMWRSFSHWVGGMGVLVLVMAFVKMSGGQNMYLMKAESPGPSVSKLVPRVRSTAILLYGIYFVLTVVEFILLLFSDMTLFEALNIAFATAGTGGFGINNAGFASFSSYAQIVVTIFMFLFGINFTSYFLILHGKVKEAFNTEVKVFIGIVVFAIITLTINVAHLFSGVGEAIRNVAFTVCSLISSTGFATVDFNLWPQYARTLLVMLMFVGACAGSTGGGIKVSRFLILFKNMSSEFRVMTHPRQVKKTKLDGQVIPEETVRTVHVYFACYIMLYAVSMLILSFNGLDLTTNFTSVVATLNNIGPGLEAAGPMSTYAVFSTPSKCVLIFNMLAGRLELFPIILLLSPSTWKK